LWITLNPFGPFHAGTLGAREFSGKRPVLWCTVCG
jgi:hypothetical protein